jgi:hypothetical protein
MGYAASDPRPRLILRTEATRATSWLLGPGIVLGLVRGQDFASGRRNPRMPGGVSHQPGATRRKETVDGGNLAKRSGWITFAGIAALIAGAYNALSGIAALSDDDTLAAQAQDVLYGIDLTAWGWFWLIVGLLQLLTGVLILQRNMWGLWLGVGIASLSALMTVLVMFVFPLWAIAVLTIDFLVLFALLTESEGFTA